MTADFYMSSCDSPAYSKVRSCRKLRMLRLDGRIEAMLVSVEPHIIGQWHGLGGHDLSQLVLVSRHVGVSLESIHPWPLAVHAYRMLTKDVGQAEMPLSAVQSVVWCELHESYASAREVEKKNYDSRWDDPNSISQISD